MAGKKLDRLTLNQLRASTDRQNFLFFNDWVLEFFKREAMREEGIIDQYTHDPKFGPAMRQEVSFWNPNRSKHAEVFWLEKFVFGRKDVSIRSQILNAMVVKFVGMPTLTLVASDTTDYANVIDFDEYAKHGEYYDRVNSNLDTNRWKLKVWGATQLQTSLQTAARNFVRSEENNPNLPFKLSHMIRWIEHLDNLGLSSVVINPANRLHDVCEWLLQHRGIGPYFGYHPPTNFSRSNELNHIDEDDDYCLIGPGAKRGLQFIFPSINFNKNDVMEQYILSIRDHQYDFFEFKDEKSRDWYSKNLERGGFLTTFGTEITCCQFACYQAIKDNAKAQEKRILPLTFDAFVKIADDLKVKRNEAETAIDVTKFFGRHCE